MNPTQKDQKGKDATTDREHQGKESNDSSRTVRKNDDHSSGETKEEPTPPETPATPDIPITPNPSGDPRREYDDTGHEHVHHPPKAESSAAESMRGFVGE